MQKSLIIFDLDGTLIDSAPDLAAATNAMLDNLGAKMAQEEAIRSWVGNGSLKLVERALSWAALPLDEAFLHTAHELFLNHYKVHVCEKTVAYNGVNEGLNALVKHGFTLAIATNKPSVFVSPILQTLGWQDYFVQVLGGDSLPVKKPDPVPLLHICQTQGVLPEHAIMVGDSKNDVLAGQNAQITTLALTYGYNYGESITKYNPDAVFDDFGALTAYILENFA